MIMNGLELNKVNQFIIKLLKCALEGNLFAIVSTGSVARGYYKEKWSDIDVLVVAEKLDLKTKGQIATAVNILEKKYKKHFGLNVISKQEFQKPVLPTISMEGKTLQSLLELKMFPNRIIFCKDKSIKNIYFPTKEDVKKYSISNIAMFLLRNRRTLCSQKTKLINDYKNIVTKEMRASFIITKLAIQYFVLHTCVNNEEIEQMAGKVFPDFNFETLKVNLRAINIWDKTKKRSQLDALLILNDSFIENFSHYVFEKTKK